MTEAKAERTELIGALLGNYRVLRKLGEGGMGEVYVGRHEALGNNIAVKVLQRELSGNTDIVQRFFNEARTTSAIRNLGIVQIFDFGRTPDGRAYFVMELLEGDTLSARLKQRRLEYAECCRLGRQVANVLQAAHTIGITHRDLKPDNLFLVADSEVVGGERVKVLDFGIAKLAGEAQAIGVKTFTGLMMGTPSYMSPEQSRGAGTADARSDIYSLGCILFEMVCGRPPFIGEGMGEILGAHQYLDPPQPRDIAPDVPAKLAKLILEMLAKKPGGRPQSMSAIGEALDEILRALEGAPKPKQPARRAPTVASTPLQPTPQPQQPQPPSQPPAVFTPPHQQPTRSFNGQQQLPPAVTAAPRSKRRLPFVLGGLVGVGGIIIAIAAGGGDSAQPPAAGSAITYDESIAPTPDAAAALPEEPPPIDAPPDAGAAPARSAAVVTAECQQLQADRKWIDLDACAAELAPMNKAAAKAFEQRATLETKAEVRIAALEAALKDQDLKQAKLELDQVPPASSNHAQAKARYDAAETAAISDLAVRLDQVNEGDCKAYNKVLAQEHATKPPRVATEAARQVKCRPSAVATAPAPASPTPAPCDPEALAEKGIEAHSMGQLAVSFELFEKAWACKAEPLYAEKAFIVACNLADAVKARRSWKRLPTTMKQRVLMICLRNGLTEEQLNQ